jgi:predicted transcriptional regulator
MKDNCILSHRLEKRMLYFDKNDWEYFTKDDGKNDGKKFESLVQKILELEYNSSAWEPTQASWDGNKDFYLYNKDNRMWAECKNYKNRIGVNVLSPTLVMAQIYDVDEILFFSFSQINDNAKNKIIQFGNVCNKNIYFYDDTALEQVVLKHKEALFPIFFKNIDEAKFKYVPVPPLINVHILHKPLLAYNSNDEELFQKQFPEEVKLGQLMSIFISICNRNFSTLPVKIQIDKDNADFYSFELSPNEIKNGLIETTIPPFGHLSKQIFVKQCIYKEHVKFPSIKITEASGQKEHTHPFHFNEYECKRVREGLMIGSSYRSIVKQFEMDISSRGKFHGLFFYGTSGTGKTRLLTECIQHSLNYEYRVLQFTGHRNSDEKKSPEVNFIVREIIYAAYNIPNEETLYISEEAVIGNANKKCVENSDLSNNIKNALIMIHAFSRETNKKKMISLIDKYVEVIFERLSSQHILISVDNIQFFDETVLYLLEKLIMYGNNINRKCGFVLLGIFNTDYISVNSKVMQLLNHLRHLPQINILKLTGFSDNNEAVTFLLQLLNLNVDLENKYLLKIINVTGKNPFQIRQTVEWLQENDIILPSKSSFLIKDIDLFYKKIADIPSEVNRILLDRWMHFINLHSEEESLLIISALHFMDGMSKRDIIWLELNNEILNAFVERNFIKKHENLWVFEHDLFEKFFCERYIQLSMFCVNKIMKKKLNTVSLPLMQQIYIKMIANKQPNESELFEFYEQVFENPLSQKHLCEYLSLLFDLYINSVHEVNDVNMWCSHIVNICAEMRNRLGSVAALPLYNKIGQLYKSKEYSYLLNTIGYGYFMGRFCESLNENGQYVEALNALITYMNKAPFKSVDSDEDIEWQKLKCGLLNRRHCYKRHLCDDPENNKEVLNDLFESIELSRHIGFNSIEYTNHSDWGYVYYCEHKNKSKILEIWNKACNYFEKGLNPHAELNYIRKKVQIALIKQDFETAERECLHGLEYTDTGKYAYEQLFFKNWFCLNLAESLLLNNPKENKKRIYDTLISAEEYDVLLGTTKKFNIDYLRSLYYYYIEEYDSMLESFCKAYEAMKNSTYIKFKTKTLGILSDNLRVIAHPIKDSVIGQLKFINDKLFLQELKNIFLLSGSEYKIMLQNYNARSLIRSKDKKLNFPCI